MEPSKENIPVRPDGLQVDERKTLQARIWLFQRVSWLVMLILVALAVAGFTGDGGWVAERTVTADQAIVTGPRFLRRSSTARMSVTFVGERTLHRLALGADFVGQFDIEATSPPPQTTRLSDDRQVMAFAADGAGPQVVTLLIRARAFGRADFVIDVDGTAVNWQAFVLP